MISVGKSLAALVCLVTVFSISAFAQNAGRESTATQEPTAGVANEIALLRRSVQSLNTSLRDIGDKLLSPDTKEDDKRK
ncbi:MAG TPA: hypothetical protein VJT71_19495, partial [Pyrinomonadaceae bacterium]|nr:hypothetical protein [Pyrinomonadaceae bacterium]